MTTQYLFPAFVFAAVAAVGAGWIAWTTHARATKAEAALERALRAQHEATELAKKADAAISRARRTAGELDASTCENALDSIRRALREQK